MDWDAIFEWIGRFAVVLTFVGGFAVWFGKTYVDKWLTKRFQGQMDDLKHVQAQEIERLRAKIAGSLDRATKLHQREFEVLPKAWDLLATALGSATRVTARFQPAIANPSNATPEGLEILLAKTPFDEEQKQAVRNAKRFDKETVFHDLMMRYAFADAEREAQEFHNYTIQFGIFIEPSIRVRLSRVSSELRSGLYVYRQRFELPQVKPWPIAEAQAHIAKASEYAEEIDKMITDRLWSAVKLDD
ncbi:hypothetical protein [Brevundimonas albigilva]|uniref:Uncharacterized protein n=1 Tax=Brevundimonas albigilva TaxID=1312364 RepID=A0ABY4SNX9_9CAUL|nr:hypothetical protein [Brevundimonas albigilva]URI15959.1 hypothetical protein M8231_02925 [Brevundimonas albigilva]